MGCKGQKKKKKVASTSSTHLCILYYGYDMIYGNLEYVLAMLSWTLSFPFIPHQIFPFIPHQIFPFFFLVSIEFLVFVYYFENEGYDLFVNMEFLPKLVF